jgi:hypothetical protein
MAYTVDYLTARGTLRIQLGTAGAADATARFRLPSEDELASASWKTANWTGTADNYSTSDLDTMGDLLRLPSVSTTTTIVETGLLDISPVHCLYLHCDLPTFDTIGPKGEADIVQRVPVTTSFGYVLHYIANGASEEFFPLGKLSFQEMNFRLTNVHNKVVDLHGGQMSVELMFDDRAGRL